MNKRHVLLSEAQVAAIAYRHEKLGHSYSRLSRETGASRNTVYNRIKGYNERRKQNGCSQ